MTKRATIFLLAMIFLGGCKKKAEGPPSPSQVQADSIPDAEPPQIDVGMSVEQAYEAIPHRRTIWDDADTTVPADERAYLDKIFQVLDEGVAIRVAGMQNYAAGNFDSSDPAAEYGQLIAFVKGMQAPKELAAYHQDVIAGLTGHQQFFAEWKAQGGSFGYAENVASHPAVQRASAALRAAYGQLMAKFPNEAAHNKDAFFDYHCALDFL